MANEDLTTEFSDPAMKAAVKRCWGKEKAPTCVCERIEGLFRCREESAGASRGISQGSSRPWRISRAWIAWPAAAIAAMFAVVIGYKTISHSTPPLPNPLAPSAPALLASLPASFEADLIKTHEHCCHVANHHHLQAPKDDDAAIAVAMQARLSQPAVLVARPADPKWDFRGAAICPVGKTPAGHLVFAKDDNVISVFTLPASALPGTKDGNHFETTADGHPIAAFARNGGLFCLVESGPAGTMSVEQLTQIRDRMEGNVTTAYITPAEQRTTVTELIYPNSSGR